MKWRKIGIKSKILAFLWSFFKVDGGMWVHRHYLEITLIIVVESLIF